VHPRGVRISLSGDAPESGFCAYGCISLPLPWDTGRVPSAFLKSRFMWSAAAMTPLSHAVAMTPRLLAGRISLTLNVGLLSAYGRPVGRTNGGGIIAAAFEKRRHSRRTPNFHRFSHHLHTAGLRRFSWERKRDAPCAYSVPNFCLTSDRRRKYMILSR